MKCLFLSASGFLMINLVFGQNVIKIKKSSSTPPSYYQVVSKENGEIDTAMMFEPPDDFLEIVKGPKKYKKEVIGICKFYSKILDSLQNDRFDKMSRDSLWSEKEMKNRTQNYKGYDGGDEGYLMSEEDDKIKTIINRFLTIDRISSHYKGSSNGGSTVYTFYYYRTIKDPNGTKRSINGKVFWVDD